MGKVILVKQATNEQPIRHCKNCGKDISNKRRNAQFCCPTCRVSYAEGVKGCTFRFDRFE